MGASHMSRALSPAFTRAFSVTLNFSACSGVKPGGAFTQKYGRKPWMCARIECPSLVTPYIRTAAARASAEPRANSTGRLAMV